MKITVRFHAQLRQAAGVSVEALEVPDDATVATALQLLAESRSPLRQLLLTDTGEKSPTLLVFLSDSQVGPADRLRPGGELLLLTPIAGGGRTPWRPDDH